MYPYSHRFLFFLPFLNPQTVRHPVLLVENHEWLSRALGLFSVIHMCTSFTELPLFTGKCVNFKCSLNLRFAS